MPTQLHQIKHLLEVLLNQPELLAQTRPRISSETVQALRVFVNQTLDSLEEMAPAEFWALNSFLDDSSELIHTTTAEGQLLFANQRWQNLLGYHLNELPNLNIDALLDNESRATYHSAHQTLLAGAARQRVSVTLISRKGKPRHLTGYLVRHAPPNRPLQVRAFLIHTAEISAVEEELRDNLERFRNMVELSPDAIIIHSNAKLIYANQAAANLIGAGSIEAILNQPVLDFVHPDSRPIVLQRIRAALETGEPQPPAEEKLIAENGEIIDVETLSKPTTFGGQPAIIVIVRDIRARKLQETNLRRTQKLESLGVMASGISHDFNNILTAVQLQTSLAMKKVGSDHPARQNLVRALEAAERAASLVRQIMIYSGRTTLQMQQVELPAVIDATRDLLSTAISRQVDLTWVVADNLPAVKGDAGDIQQILSNLIINSAEAIGDHAGKITVTIAPHQLDQDEIYTLDRPEVTPGQFVRLEVNDNGPGMPPEILERIFDPFFSTRFAGRGLGLPVVQGIVHSYGGAIRVHSQPDIGTQFEVFLPIATAEQAETPTRPRLKLASHATKSHPGILFIDDELFLREAMPDILATILPSAQVFTAPDGETAIQVLKSHSEAVDLVILDLTMPTMSGEECFTELKKIKPEIAIVLASGYTLGEMQARFVGRDVAGFLPKPFTPESVSAIVRRLLLN